MQGNLGILNRSLIDLGWILGGLSSSWDSLRFVFTPGTILGILESILNGSWMVYFEFQEVTGGGLLGSYDPTGILPSSE